MTRRGRGIIVVTILSAVAAGGACTRKPAPDLQPAAAPPPPPPPTPVVVRDAAPDVGDAATDATDARPAAAKKPAAAPAGGGGGGLKIEGKLSRADGEKVVRSAQGKLRACGSGKKGRVSFKLTVDDRGHVTVVNIPTSTLPGGSEVETCMVHVLRDLLFPRGAGESTISFQMSFGR